MVTVAWQKNVVVVSVLPVLLKPQPSQRADDPAQGGGHAGARQKGPYKGPPCARTHMHKTQTMAAGRGGAPGFCTFAKGRFFPKWSMFFTLCHFSKNLFYKSWRKFATINFHILYHNPSTPGRVGPREVLNVISVRSWVCGCIKPGGENALINSLSLKLLQGLKC